MTNLSKTYYVSSVDGCDLNDGLSVECPFNSLFKINGLKLNPGDKVLLERGSIFSNQFLQIKDSGTKGNPIIVGAYGDGELPCIETNGQGIWYQDYGNPLD